MKNPLRNALLLIALFASGMWLVDARGDERPRTMSNYLVYIGTYTGPKSQGIYVYRFAAATGKLTPLGLAAESTNPAFLAIHPNHHHLYAVNEIAKYDGQKSGSVSAFSINHQTGKLTLLNVVASGDPGPCHLVVDQTGKFLLVANYGVGSVAAFPILADGRLGKATAFLPHTGHSVDPKRQEAPHAHSIYVSPDNRFVVSADLGTDQVYVYRFDATQGTLTPNQPPSAAVPPGTGPRHFTFHPSAKFAYVIEEMGSSLTAFSYDAARGVLAPLETISTVPKDYKGYNDCAELYIHPSGKFLYGSNRGHDSITVFAIDPVKGTPTPIQYVLTGGKTPRSFGIDPTGSYLIAANQDSNTLVVFHIDAKTGRLTPTGQKEDVHAPICVMFEPVE
ncbi:MAG: lactonase family protein [Terriglobia bacterium]|jgi:6-phosphogluconolactonase